MNLLTVLNFTSDDHAQADALLSLIADYNGKQPSGHLLLVAAPDVHEELVGKLAVTAEIAFESVTVLPVPWPTKNGALGKEILVNHCFRIAAATVAERFQWPFLWLEPDCVPLTPNWLEFIQEAYSLQPKRYLSAWMKDGKTGQLSMNRVGVYPCNAVLQLATFFDQPAPFELQAGAVTVQRSTKSNLFQVMRYDKNTERSKVKAEAVILHGDKEGVLLSAVREEWKKEPYVWRASAKSANGANPAQEHFQKPEPVATKDEIIHDPLTNTTSLGDVTVPAEKPRRGRPPTPKPASLTVNA